MAYENVAHVLQYQTKSICTYHNLLFLYRPWGFINHMTHRYRFGIELTTLGNASMCGLSCLYKQRYRLPVAGSDMLHSQHEPLVMVTSSNFNVQLIP